MLRDNGHASISGHYMPMELNGNEVKSINTTIIQNLLDASEAMGEHWVIVLWMIPEWRIEAGAL